MKEDLFPTAEDIPRELVLTPLHEFEKDNGITETRDDMPYNPFDSGYYKEVDMDVEKLYKKLEPEINKLLEEA